jgi:HEAT repeat protein
MPLIRKPSAPASPPTHGPSAAALREGTTDERWAAARNLATPPGVAALAEALRTETEPRVREAILTSLARIATPEAAQAVIPHIRSDDAVLRTAALDALCAMPAAVSASLPTLLADPDGDVRLLACELVRAEAGAGATRLLCDLLDRETEPNVCGAAVEVLAEIGSSDAAPVLARCAVRFADQPFLAFSIRVALERIGAPSADRLG